MNCSPSRRCPSRGARTGPLSRSRSGSRVRCDRCVENGAISLFVGTSLAVAADSLFAHRLGPLPTILAALGVLAMFAASILLARESTLAVKAVNEEMDHRHLSS